MGITAGCDLDCGGFYSSNLADAVNEGVLKESDLDQALIRVFKHYIMLGVLDDPSFVEFMKFKGDGIISVAANAFPSIMSDSYLSLLWEEEKNTFHYFQMGSEHIGDHEDFQQYKGKLDMVFTSPPYFDREQYSADEEQSFKSYPMYHDWRDNFLKPTLTNAFNSLNSDRYLSVSYTHLTLPTNREV